MIGLAFINVGIQYHLYAILETKMTERSEARCRLFQWVWGVKPIVLGVFRSEGRSLYDVFRAVVGLKSPLVKKGKQSPLQLQLPLDRGVVGFSFTASPIRFVEFRFVEKQVGFTSGPEIDCPIGIAKAMFAAKAEFTKNGQVADALRLQRGKWLVTGTIFKLPNEARRIYGKNPQHEIRHDSSLAVTSEGSSTDNFWIELCHVLLLRHFCRRLRTASLGWFSAWCHGSVCWGAFQANAFQQLVGRFVSRVLRHQPSVESLLQNTLAKSGCTF